MTAAHPVEPVVRSPRRGLLVFLPLIGFACLAALFFVRLQSGDPSRLPSALVGRSVPPFTLDAVPGLDRPGLHDADLKAGHVSVVNVFASWCVECHDEHPALMSLAADPALKAAGATLVGIAYKDRPEDARRYLNDKGDPFAAVGQDLSGRTGIDFGVYGVPETFVIRPDGTVAYKLIGGVTRETIGPLLAAVNAAAH